MGKKPIDKAFASRLATLRKQRGFTMQDLAKKIGVSRRTILYYETKSKHTPSHLIPQLAKAFNVSVEELLGLKKIRNVGNPAHATLWRQLRRAEELPPEDQKALIGFLNALLKKNRK
jgi:transcriptional regulator with XRE-family HTH domain